MPFSRPPFLEIVVSAWARCACTGDSQRFLLSRGYSQTETVWPVHLYSAFCVKSSFNTTKTKTFIQRGQAKQAKTLQMQTE